MSDTFEVRDLVKWRLASLAEMREHRLKEEVLPQYQVHLESSEQELLQALARRLAVITRTNGVASGGTNPQRFFEIVLGNAQANRNWQPHIDEALAHFTGEMGMEA